MLTLESEYRENCPDCIAGVDEFHSENCDVARCAASGFQLISCFLHDEDHECQPTKWSGYWPGVEECFEYGLFAWFWPNVGFIRCGPDHPEAICDLNRLIIHYRWDAKLQKRVPNAKV